MVAMRASSRTGSPRIFLYFSFFLLNLMFSNTDVKLGGIGFPSSLDMVQRKSFPTQVATVLKTQGVEGESFSNRPKT